MLFSSRNEVLRVVVSKAFLEVVEDCKPIKTCDYGRGRVEADGGAPCEHELNVDVLPSESGDSMVGFLKQRLSAIVGITSGVRFLQMSISSRSIFQEDGKMS